MNSKLTAGPGIDRKLKGAEIPVNFRESYQLLCFGKSVTDKDVEEDIGIKGKRGKRIPVHIEVNMKKYDEMVNKYKVQYGRSTAIVQKEIRNELSRTAFDLKRDHCMKWIGDFLESGEKLVVFCFHHKVMDDICAAFPKDSVRIDGSVTGKKREKAAQEFKTDKNLGVFQILSMVKVSIGLLKYVPLVHLLNSRILLQM